MYQWIIDNGMTPHLLVDAKAEGCQVPVQHVQDGKIVLNIAPMAINSLTLGDEQVSFSARFSGKAMNIQAPIRAVLAIYARENGQGMMFTDEDGALAKDASDSDDGPDTDPDKPRPTLRVVK
jgi:stringent starvation protein B